MNAISEIRSKTNPSCGGSLIKEPIKELRGHQGSISRGLSSGHRSTAPSQPGWQKTTRRGLQPLTCSGPMAQPRSSVRDCIPFAGCWRRTELVCSASSAEQLTGTEGLISSRRESLDSLMADEGLRPGWQHPCLSPNLFLEHLWASRCRNFAFLSPQQGLTSTTAPGAHSKVSPWGWWRRQSPGCLLGTSLLPEHWREGPRGRVCSLSSHQRHELSKSDKTISSVARQRLNKDELPGESCSRGSLDIVPFITINTMGSAGVTVANKPPGTSLWAPLALQPGRC